MNRDNVYKIYEKKAQSTGEYLIFVAAVISVALIFMRPGGYFAEKVTMTYNTTTNGMTEMSTRLADSRDMKPPTTIVTTSSSASVGAITSP